MNWITQKKRLGIYLRDGLCCSYCGEGVEAGAQLTLDHLKPHSKGGSNGADNLVTCCKRCNTSRGTRSVAAFCRATAAYINHGVTAADIAATVRRNSRRSLAPFLAQAADLVALRGSAAKAISGE